MLAALWWSNVSGSHRGPTLRRQHGSCSLMEVEQLLQEQDGLREGNALRRHMIDCTTAVCRFRGDHPGLPRSRGRAETESVKVPMLKCNKSKHVQSCYTTFVSLCVCVCALTLLVSSCTVPSLGMLYSLSGLFCRHREGLASFPLMIDYCVR